MEADSKDSKGESGGEKAADPLVLPGAGSGKPAGGRRIRLETVRYAFWNIVWPRRRLVLLGLGLILVNRAAGLVLPASSKYVIDNAIVQGNLGMLRWLLLAVSVAIVFQATSSFFLTRLLSVEAQHLISRFRVAVQQHVLYLPVRFFDTAKTGELVSRVMTDVEGVRNLVGTGLVQAFGGTLTAIAALVLLFLINAQLTLLVLLPLVIFGAVSLKAFGFIRPLFRERSKINAEVTGRLTETLGGIRVIKGFNAESHEIGVFHRGVERLFENVRKSLTATSLVTSGATLLLGFAAVGITGLGGYRIIQGEMTIGDFFAFFIYLGFLISPVLEISSVGSQITEAFAGLDRTRELLAVPQEQSDPRRTVQLGVVQGHIRFEDVRFGYGEDSEVLHGVSFDAPAGTVTALVGSSGSGKTTIASLAASFISPRQGTVEIDGQDLAEVVLDTYRRQLGVVLQEEFLFDGTIRENLLFGRRTASEAELRAAAEAAHVLEFVQRMEKGMETVIGERGVRLSGGQRQRLAIARALLADPRILILDEATSNLDTESERLIQESLRVLMRGRTTLVIAHRLSTIRQADQILVVESGQIVERGRHDELMEKGGRYFELYTYQARI